MSIFNKLLFWKKDHFDFGSDLNKNPLDSGLPKDNLGLPDSFGQNDPFKQTSSPFGSTTNPSATLNPNDPFAQPSQTSNSTQNQNTRQQQYMQQQINNRDLELINSKLDTIKTLLQSLDQRTARLEQVAGVQKQPEQRLW